MPARVAVIGDCTLDVTVRPAAATRAAGDVPARVEIGPGGQGANVAVRLARRGISVVLAAAVADDAAGRLLRERLADESVNLAPLTAARTGSVVALLDAGGERTMLSDRVTIDPREAASACAGAAWVHCSAYPLADDTTGDALAAALGSLSAGARVSVAGGSLPPDPALAARVRSRIAQSGASLLVFSRDEAASLLAKAHPSLEEAAAALRAAFPGVIAIVTGGVEGSAVAADGIPIHVIGRHAAVVDATGAGDAYAAAMIAGLCDSPWPPTGARLAGAAAAATELGAQVAGVLGAQPRVPGEAAVERLP